MMTVRRLASTPSVTCSAVDADPNPLAPALPVMSEKIPISDSTPQFSNKVTKNELNSTELNQTATKTANPRKERKGEQRKRHGQETARFTEISAMRPSAYLGAPRDLFNAPGSGAEG